MSRPPPNPAARLWALGAGLIVAAARWHEIRAYGGEIPFYDPWLIEAKQILLPWLDGRLTPADFLAPHHEHLPGWTRLLGWLAAAGFGQWNNQLQATLNAVIMGGFTGLVAGWLRRQLPAWPALALTLLAVTLASLPHSWENIVWGFQSPMPLALLLVFRYAQGVFTQPVGQTGWWLAQAAGLAALLTLGSMAAAPIAVLLVLGWTSGRDRKQWLGAGLLAAGGIILLLVARAQQPPTGAGALGAGSVTQFLAALLLQLGWPSAWPGAALLLNGPVLLLAWRIRGKAETAATDRTVLTLALWAMAQAAAFAYARGSYVGFVSRYGDLLALGVVANAVALWRLLAASGGGTRVSLAVLALGWGTAVGCGLFALNTVGHTLYFHEHAAQWNQQRRDTVQRYLVTKDPGLLSTAEARAVLFSDPATVATVLDHPGMTALLPATVRPGSGSTPGDAWSERAGVLRERWFGAAAGGGAMLLVGFLLGRRPTAAERPDQPPAMRPLPAVVPATLALTTAALLFLWPQPFAFRTAQRWAALLTPPGTVADVRFHITTETNYPKDNLAGGAALWPEDFRNLFFGTHIDGPGFTGTAESTPFPITVPWYVVPFAGYPASPGNALRLRIENASGKILKEITCPGPNPGPGQRDVGFWAVDARRYAGLTGRLVIQDQRTDAEGWIAVAPPHPAAEGERLAAEHRRRWAEEDSLSGLQALQVIGAIFVLLAAISLFPPTRRLLC